MIEPSVESFSPRRVSWGKRIFKQIGRFGFNTIIVSCWILIIIMALLTWAPHVSKYKTDVIIGPSMEPTIPLYSVIVVEPIKPSAIKKGDVITFNQPEVEDRKVTHRVFRVLPKKDGKSRFETKGDNNDVKDPWVVTYQDTAYRVVEHVPHVGWLMIKMQTKIARIVLVVLPVLLILFQFLKWVWVDDERVDLEDSEEVEAL